MGRKILKSWGLFLIIGFYIIGIIFVLPHFNFPLNDDWVYSKMTKVFYERGKIEFLNWGEPTLVFQIWWGALFCRLLGFSFHALHASTLLLSLVGSIAFYLILKHFKIEEYKAVLGSLVLLANPIFFFNSFTFMTDVPFLGLMLLTIYLYLKFDESDNLMTLILASIFSIAAFLIRQNGIFLPLVFFLYLLFKKGGRKRLSPLNIFWLLGLPLVVDIAFLFWRYSQPNVWSRPLTMPNALWTFQLGFYILEYIGFFTLPLMLALFLKIKNWRKFFATLNPVIFAVIFLSLTGCIVVTKKFMPYLGNQISVYGMFGLYEVLAGSRPVMFPRLFWIGVTALSTLSISWIIYMIVMVVRARVRSSLVKLEFFESSKEFIFLFTLLQLLFPLIIGNAFDRYILVLIPGVVLFVLDASKRFEFSKTLSIIGLLFFLSLSVVLTYNTINWNKARWAEGRSLLKTGIPVSKIDGGFEWNGWFYPKPVGSKHADTVESYFKPWYLRKIFPDIDNEYVISFSPLEGYKIVKKRRYACLCLDGEQYIYVLHRKNKPIAEE